MYNYFTIDIILYLLGHSLYIRREEGNLIWSNVKNSQHTTNFMKCYGSSYVISGVPWDVLFRCEYGISDRGCALSKMFAI